jgi:hypothetical protein
MKKILTLVAILSIMISTTEAQSLKQFFRNYEKDSRFQSVSVGKFLLTLPLIFGNVDKNDREFLSCINKIKVLASNSVLDAEFSTTVLNDLDKIIYQGNYESMVDVREKGEKVKIYCHSVENKNSDLLIVVSEKDEMNIIWINGKLSAKMMEKFHDQLANNPSNILNNLH